MNILKWFTSANIVSEHDTKLLKAREDGKDFVHHHYYRLGLELTVISHKVVVNRLDGDYSVYDDAFSQGATDEINAIRNDERKRRKSKK